MKGEKVNNTAYIGLGSNKGDREKYLISAIEKIDIDPECEVEAVSSVYETEPYGVKDQGDFLNAVIRINTEYSPVDLFSFLKSIENDLGREKTIKWGPREIDLDILFYNDLIYSDENIIIPHKGITEREFVLIPLNEIDPDFVHPVTSKKISDLIQTDREASIKNKFTLSVSSK